VEKGMVTITEAYKKLHAEKKLEVRYPDTDHNFPPEVRLEAYKFIDKALRHRGGERKLLF
jgi:hypothetical protein